MYQYLQRILLLICLFIAMVSSTKILSLDNVYKNGVKAFTEERWSKCIEHFEDSLHLYKLYKTILLNCRLKCKNNPNVIMKENIDDLKTIEKYFISSQCLQQCKNEGFKNINMYSNVSQYIVFDMQSRKPYGYLHLCYFQMYALPKAASAVYTFLIVNPDDETMKKNLVYYTKQPEVDINEVDDLESEDYQILYRLGLKSYYLEKWGETIANMEESLTGYLSWENSCRAECDWQPDQECSEDISISISNSLASLLICHQNCQQQLKPLYNSGVEFLADLLNYLQICYYHLDRFDDMGKAVSSYLLLLPSDEDMLDNKEFYKTILEESSFMDRSDIVHYFKRDQYEKQLLKFFHDQIDYKIEANSV